MECCPKCGVVGLKYDVERKHVLTPKGSTLFFMETTRKQPLLKAS